MIPPAFLDDGAPGTWLDAIFHSPLLNVSDHAGSDLPDALAAPAPVSVPFHDAGVSQ